MGLTGARQPLINLCSLVQKHLFMSSMQGLLTLAHVWWQLRGQSEADEDEMGAVTLVRQGQKVVAGSQDGVLSIFSWGYFNDCSDRFPGEHQLSYSISIPPGVLSLRIPARTVSLTVALGF